VVADSTRRHGTVTVLYAYVNSGTKEGAVMKWTPDELRILRQYVQLVEAQAQPMCTVYYAVSEIQVQLSRQLNSHRPWSGIRSKLWRERMNWRLANGRYVP